MALNYPSTQLFILSFCLHFCMTALPFSTGFLLRCLSRPSWSSPASLWSPLPWPVWVTVSQRDAGRKKKNRKKYDSRMMEKTNSWMTNTQTPTSTHFTHTHTPTHTHTHTHTLHPHTYTHPYTHMWGNGAGGEWSAGGGAIIKTENWSAEPRQNEEKEGGAGLSLAAPRSFASRFNRYCSDTVFMTLRHTAVETGISNIHKLTHTGRVHTSLTLLFWLWLVVSSVFAGRSAWTSYLSRPPPPTTISLPLITMKEDRPEAVFQPPTQGCLQSCSPTPSSRWDSQCHPWSCAGCLTGSCLHPLSWRC